ncbi:site-specific integrase [bacterium]|nr:site-specific integrase [bacterium]
MAYYEKRSKNTYKLVVSLGYDSSGKHKRVSKTVKIPDDMTQAKREKELNVLCVLFEKQVNDGLYLEGEKITFEEFTETWLKDYANINLSPSTLTSYKTKLSKRILPAIGNIKLSKLQPNHLMKLYHSLNEADIRFDKKYISKNELVHFLSNLKAQQIENDCNITYKTYQKLINSLPVNYNIAQRVCEKYNFDISKTFNYTNSKTLSPKTIRSHMQVVSTILAAAVRWNVIKTNPALNIDLKKYRKPKTTYYDDNQVANMLSKLSNEQLMCQTLIYLTLDTGFRKSEVSGLTWEDIDFDSCKIRINKQRLYVTGYGVINTSPKTEAGTREVTISKTVINLLKIYRNQQLESKLKLGTAWKNEPYVFLHEDGSAISPNFPYRWFTNFLKKYNLPKITFHQLRHTNASLLISSGEDIVTVSGRLGHADKNITLNTYSHIIKSKEEQVANKMDEFYAKFNVC